MHTLTAKQPRKAVGDVVLGLLKTSGTVPLSAIADYVRVQMDSIEDDRTQVDTIESPLQATSGSGGRGSAGAVEHAYGRPPPLAGQVEDQGPGRDRDGRKYVAIHPPERHLQQGA